MESHCPSLSLSALRLLVPPIRLVSAAVWQTLQQKVVADYGVLEEFVSTVTDVVPELLTTRQRAQLLLGLRARLILELCQFETISDCSVVQSHLSRVQQLTETLAGSPNMEVSQFVDLVKKLLENPEEKETFFKDVFPVEFGSTYDDALHALMWLFLSRLEKFLPLQTFQQVASMFGGTSSVLKECLVSVSPCEELRTLLHYQKDFSQLHHNDTSLDDTCIISALNLASEEKTKTDDNPQAGIMDKVLSSDVEKGSSTLSHNTTTEMQADETNWTSEVTLGEITGREGNASRLQVEDAPHLLKQCRVQLKRLEMPLWSRPVRQNRGLRMKRLVMEEKRNIFADSATSRRTKPSSEESDSFSEDNSSYPALLNNGSDDDSWSYYSDDSINSRHSIADSWSNYSGDESPVAIPLSSSTEGDSLSSSTDVNPSSKKNQQSASRKRDVSDVNAPKETRRVQCLICNERVNTSLRSHMKTHFPDDDYACPHCDSRFKLLSSLRLHLKRTCFEFSHQPVDPEKPAKAKNLFKCDKCDEAFTYKVSLQKHKLTHDELYCKVCRKVLRDAATLARHKSSHTSFQCNRCEETFTLFKPLLRHCENIHKIRRPFKCNYCHKVVSKLRILIAHEWKHTGHLPFQCAQCCLRFRCDADLSSHERVHTREKPYLCAECGKTFSQRSNLLRHLNFIHGESRDQKKYSCTECEKSFKEKGALKKHQKMKHLNELFRHPCPYCGKMVSASSIARHKLIHTGERPFKCTVSECDKYYRSTSEVTRHVLMHHTTERPFKCDVCGKGFIKRGYLNTHTKTHSGEKPFVCNFCGKAFLKRYSMQRHKKLVHTFALH